MNSIEVWQQLLSLESRDVTTRWFDQLHSRELSARRAKEINAAAKQAREYFRNASEAAYSVRPLLTFYGVTCLSRSLLLLLKPNGGEETLTASHGLEAVNWASVMAGDVANAIGSLSNLRIRSTSGLFSDFLANTLNKTCVHVNSAAVDGSICYPVPQNGLEVSLGELFARVPDLHERLPGEPRDTVCAAAHSISFTEVDGFKAQIRADSHESIRAAFEADGYQITTQSDFIQLTATTPIYATKPPLLVHTYIHKMFGTIPTLYLAAPFASGARYSQLAITYMVGYALGMLVRYYPTHWMALIQSEKGDTLWPTINRAQHFVETAYPELIVEFIHDQLKGAREQSTKAKVIIP